MPLFANAISTEIDDNAVIHVTELNRGNITLSIDTVPQVRMIVDILWVAICAS